MLWVGLKHGLCMLWEGLMHGLCMLWAGLMHGLCMLWVDLGRSHAPTMYVVGRSQVRTMYVVGRSHAWTMYVVGRPGKVSTVSQVGEWPPPLLPIPYYTCWLWLYWLSSQSACNLLKGIDAVDPYRSVLL